jgi:hypothetical protein
MTGRKLIWRPVPGRHAPARRRLLWVTIVSAGLDLFCSLSLDKLGVFHGETCERIDEDVGDIGRYAIGTSGIGLSGRGMG